MTRRAAIAVATAGLVAASCALTGCSAGATDSAPPSTESPLARYVALIYGTDDEAASAQRDRQVQYLTAACMTGRGFPYVPEDAGPSTSVGQDHPDDPAWVARWGYGIVEHPDAEGRQVAYQPAANAAYIASLGGAAYGAYYVALYGDGSPLSWTTSCYGSSSAQVNGVDVTKLLDNEWLANAIVTMETSPSDDDPDLLAIDTEWAGCMTSAGYPGFSSPTNARLSVRNSAAAIDVTKTDQLDAAHRDEVYLALADLGCRQDLDYTDRYTTIQYAAELDFLHYWQPDLDALVAQAQAARAAAAARN